MFITPGRHFKNERRSWAAEIVPAHSKNQAYGLGKHKILTANCQSTTIQTRSNEIKWVRHAMCLKQRISKYPSYNIFLHAWKPSTLPTWQNSISNYKHDQHVRDIFRVYPKFIRINIQTLKHCSLMSLQPWNGCICDLCPYLHQAQCLGSTHKSQTNPSNSLTF
jgi:hypothetical protein